MPAPLSIDLRRRVVNAYHADEGGYQKIAKHFSVSIISVRRWVRLQKTTSQLDPKPHTAGPPRKIPASKIPKLKELVAEKPDRTLAELTYEWAKREGVQMHLATMGRALIKAGLTFKKNFSSRRKKSR